MPELELEWTKGHGTENDFVLLYDPDGRRFDADRLDPETVRLLCDRRRGVGADGVLRVVPAGATDDGRELAEREAVGSSTWFMDFRNADGSVGEMCGNGVRVFARYLAEMGLVDPSGDRPVPVLTRAGVKLVRFGADGVLLTVDMGTAGFPPSDGLVIRAGDGSGAWPAVAVDMGNPHAVAHVDDLLDPGPLLAPPTWEPAEVFEAGVNVEFAVRRDARHLALRVHERGVGETRSCGTGACAVAAATARADGISAPWSYRVDVPGGTLQIVARSDGRLEMTGPAVLVARGVFATEPPLTFG